MEVEVTLFFNHIWQFFSHISLFGLNFDKKIKKFTKNKHELELKELKKKGNYFIST